MYYKLLQKARHTITALYIPYHHMLYLIKGSEQCHLERRLRMRGVWREGVVKEVNKQLWLAGPLFTVGLLQYSLQVISVMFVGHLGELPLSGASMASSFASVTGFNLLVRKLLSIWYKF